MRYAWSSFALIVVVLASPLSADGWRAAPLYGADVRSLAFDPGMPDRVLAGTSSGQIYESTDLGATWRPVGVRVALPGWVVSSLRFDPHHPGRVWAGLWSLWGADGTVLASEDGGRTWQARDAGLPRSQVYTLALAGDRPDEIYAATRRGVWGSTDGGATWRHLTAGHSEIGKVTSLLIDPYDSDVVYAGTWRRAYRSDDRGVTWKGIFEGMALDSEVFSLQPGPRGEGHLWASTCGWVYHGRGRGAQWSRHTTGLPERRTPSFGVLADGTLLAGTVAGIYGSDDLGAHWRARTPPLAVATIAAHPTLPAVVLVGSEGSGVWRSLDGGRTFEPSATGMVSVRVTDVVESRGGLAVSVRYAEANDGVHRVVGEQVAADGAGDLPTVLDLAAEGERLVAATESGLWERSVAGWNRLAALGSERVEEVAIGGGRVVARTASEVVAVRGDAVERVRLSSPGIGLVWCDGAFWFVDEGRLRRWQIGAPEAIASPVGVESVTAFGAKLVIEVPAGRFERAANGTWRVLAIAASRVLPTGDGDLPILALWKDGSATLYGSDGRARSELRLPVPARDVSATVLNGGRLHLATAGYGLLSSNLLLVEDLDLPGAAPAAAR